MMTKKADFTPWLPLSGPWHRRPRIGVTKDLWPVVLRRTAIGERLSHLSKEGA